ncbi:c-type cytochrome domain-containing protein [Thioalkalivibrio paradoxus]|uniref:Signal peptide protein n=1 Tax=Thioalkalivibrio paradoxus ARh 1 TaxID=713585 RepID=W0DIP1_9GAMM|nr:c-type cytochrome domain-containing protein [Thioalkalivibrio paradoxus]AHE97122.1 signal peptide protein [Thioalkalivibrio paradoxus ARh 1]
MASNTRNSMRSAMRLGLAAAGLTLAGATMVGCSDPVVSYSAQVQPILDKRCMECHTPGERGYEESGLELGSYESLMQGTRYGPVVKPGEPLISVLNQLVEGRADPSISMPHQRNPLPASEIAVLRNWVEQGAKDN